MSARRPGLLLRVLLWLYPREFRERYAESLVAFQRERIEASGALAWFAIVADHVSAAFAERASSLWRDLRHAGRGMVRRPLFAAVVISTIALGVGANAAIFSVVYGVLLRPLPYPDASRLVVFTHQAPYALVSEPELFDYRRGLRSLRSLAAFRRGEANLLIEQEPDRVGIANVSLEFFPTLGVVPERGRVFAGDDEGTPATAVIISHRLWERRLGTDQDVIGRKLVVNGIAHTIIGVMPSTFAYPSERTDVWLPLPRMNRDSLGDRAHHYLSTLGRLHDDTSVETLTAEATAFATGMMRDNASRYDPNQPLVPAISPLADVLVGPTRAYLWALLGAVALVLLVACVNVANLLLARGEGRRKELAVRAALGASRARLASQLLAESAVLCAAGGVVGLALAAAGHRVLIAIAPTSLPRVGDIRLDWAVVAHAFVVSAAAALAAGIVPAVRAGRETGNPLHEGGRTTFGTGSRRARRTLVIAEVALAVVLLNGAGLLVRSLVNLQATDMGFAPDSVLTARVSLGRGYDESRTSLFYADLLARIHGIPQVRVASMAAWLPVVDAAPTWGLEAEGQSWQTMDRAPTAAPQQAGPGYFDVMGIPLKQGRDFTEHDRDGALPVAIVSELLARQLWPGDEAVGKRFRVGGDQPYVTVVGVAGDIRARGFRDAPEAMMYFPHAQTHRSAYFMPRAMSLVVRTSADPMQVAAQIREAVRSLDATVPVSDVRTLDHVVGTAIDNRRFTTSLITGFALVALLLAGIGVFGILSFDVTERMFELGVRVALGASRLEVLGVVTRDGVRMATTGAAIGLVGAVAGARAIGSLLVDVPSFDLPTAGVVVAGLGVIVVAACALPARRALRVNPTTVLRGG